MNAEARELVRRERDLVIRQRLMVVRPIDSTHCELCDRPLPEKSTNGLQRFCSTEHQKRWHHRYGPGA